MPSSPLARLAALAGSAALLLAGSPAASCVTPLGAQAGDTLAGPVQVSRYVGQVYLSTYSRDTDLDDREWTGGFGLRFMIRPSLVEPGAEERTSRFGYGGMLTFMPAQGDLNSRTWHLAAQGEFHPWLPTPGTERLDPFASLAIGLFRTSADAAAVPGVPSGTSISTTDFALTPGIGTYWWLTPRVGLRGDLADVIVFGDRTTSNWTLAAGFALSF